MATEEKKSEKTTEEKKKPVVQSKVTEEPKEERELLYSPKQAEGVLKVNSLFSMFVSKTYESDDMRTEAEWTIEFKSHKIL